MRVLVLVVMVAAAGCLSQIVPQYDAPAVGGAQTDEPAPVEDDELPVDPIDEEPIVDEPDLGPGDMPDLATQSFEAESATLSGEFQAADDANASGGKYVVAPAGATTGKAVLPFSVPADGTYTIWGRVLAPTDANNSFHVSLDADTIDNANADGASTIWDLPVAVAWTWVKLNMRVAAGNTDVTPTLTAGAHTLYVNFREVGAQLDRLVVTSDPAYVPN